VLRERPDRKADTDGKHGGAKEHQGPRVAVAQHQDRQAAAGGEHEQCQAAQEGRVHAEHAADHRGAERRVEAAECPCCDQNGEGHHHWPAGGGGQMKLRFERGERPRRGGDRIRHQRETDALHHENHGEDGIDQVGRRREVLDQQACEHAASRGAERRRHCVGGGAPIFVQVDHACAYRAHSSAGGESLDDACEHQIAYVACPREQDHRRYLDRDRCDQNRSPAQVI